jgi:hypothetical protein
VTEADSFSDRLKAATGKAPATPEQGEEVAERFHGYVPGVQDRAHNVEWRRDGEAWLTLEYSYLVWAEWRHAGEFAVRYASGHLVTVRGRHLRRAYELLQRHRLTWLREAADGETAPDAEPWVDEIEIAAPDEGRG